MKAIVGRKLRMSRMYDEQGRTVPVTLLHVGPCKVTSIKTKERDGYMAVQLAFETRVQKRRESGKGTVSIQEKPRVLKEVRFYDQNDVAELEVGSMVTADMFEVGDKVRVVSSSKGRGFTGAVKRWGFAGGPKTHGHRHVLRAVGSIGSRFPQHTFKGLRMAGRHGAQRRTVRDLQVMHVDKTSHVVAVKGSVPGAPGTLVMVEGVSLR